MDNNLPGKGDAIIAIVAIYDELEELRRYKEQHEKIVTCEFDDSKEYTVTDIEMRMIEYARNAIYRDSINTYHAVGAWKDDETGELKAESYSEWLDYVVRDIPTFMSKDQFIGQFEYRLKSDYERKKQEAIAKLATSEEE